MATPARTALLPTVTEAAFQNAVIELARTLRWFCYHTRDSRGSAAGFPDLVLIRPPRIVFAELKRATGRLTEDQAVVLGQLRLCPGVETHCWRPGNWNDIVKILR